MYLYTSVTILNSNFPTACHLILHLISFNVAISCGGSSANLTVIEGSVLPSHYTQWNSEYDDNQDQRTLKPRDTTVITVHG